MKRIEQRLVLLRFAQRAALWCIALLCGHCTPSDPTTGTVVLLWPDQLAGASVTITWAGENIRPVVSFPARIAIPFDRPIHVRATKAGFEMFVSDFGVTRSAPLQEITIEMQEAREPDGYGLRAADVPQVVLVRTDASRPDAMGSKWLEAAYWGGFGHTGTVLSIVADVRGDVWHVSSGQPTWVGRMDPGLVSKLRDLQSPALATPFEEHAVNTKSDGAGSGISVYATSLDERGTELAREGGSRRGRRASPAANELLGWILAVRREARRAVAAQE